MAAKDPALPRSRSNPIGGTRLINRAEKRVNKSLRQTRQWLIEQLESIPTERIPDKGLVANEATYDYLISVPDLNRIVAELEGRIDDIPSDAVVDNTELAYAEGTGGAVTNLARLTDDYPRTVTAVLASQPYQRRVAMIASRVFEEMQGFKGQTAADLSRVLREGLENGQNPKVVARTIRERFGVSKSRAERIARTEITGALRRGHWDENEDARQNLGINTALMWFSALSATTRRTHASKHGEVFTPADVKAFYSRDGNAINCKCHQTSVLIGDDGEVVSKKLKERLEDQREEYISDIDSRKREERPIKPVKQKEAPNISPEAQKFVSSSSVKKGYSRPRSEPKKITAPALPEAPLPPSPPKKIRLSDQQKAAVEQYKGDGFYKLNQVLRDKESYTERQVKEAQSFATILDSAIDSSATSKDHVFYRGLRSSDLYENAENLVGKSLKNATPQSLTWDRRVADGYAGIMSGYSAERGASVIMKVNVKKGQKALNISDATDINSYEKEILLKSSSSYEVKSVENVLTPDGEISAKIIEVDYVD